MGLLPKYKIEELKRAKREAKAAKKRKENTRSKIVRFLIVCEGSRTEPIIFWHWSETGIRKFGMKK